MGTESENQSLNEMPSTAEKLVQSLKEILRSFTEKEIYAMLKECNMDPDEAAQRLLSQDTFCEVKSKRQRRKEMKDKQESRSLVNNSGLTCGARVDNSVHNVVQSGPAQISDNELDEASNDGDSHLISLLFSSPTPHVAGKDINQQSLPQSGSYSTDNRRQSIGTGDPVSASVPPSPGFQPAWLGATRVRHLTADVVKMGRLRDKGSQIADHSSAKPLQVSTPMQQEFHPDPHPQYLSNMSDDSVVDISSAATNFQRVSLKDPPRAAPPAEDDHAVVFPDHLQALGAECSHLSFGTYKSGSNSGISERSLPNCLKHDFGNITAPINGSSSGQLNTRNFGYGGDEQLTSMYNTPRTASDVWSYELPAFSRPGLMNQIVPRATLEHEVTMGHSGFSNTQQPSSAFAFARETSEITNPPVFASALYPSNVLMRDSDDLLHSSFPVTRSITRVYNNAAIPISSQARSMLEVPRTTGFSLTQSSSAHSQGLSHPYSQSNLTLEQLAYTTLGRLQQWSYEDMPSALQTHPVSNQPLSGSRYFFPGHYSGDPLSRVSLSASNVSGYGSSGTSTNHSGGSYWHSSSLNDLLPFEQNDHSSVWPYGSRSMSSVPGSTSPSLVQRNTQNNRYQLGQQHSQHHRARGYPN